MAMLPEGPREEHDVKLLADERQSDAAFFRLWSLMRPRLAKAAERFGLSADDAEDIVASVSTNLWERRASLAELSAGAFWAFSFRSAKNLAVDYLRRQGKVRTSPIEEDRDLPSGDVAYVDVIVETLLTTESLYASADRLWLGEYTCPATWILAVQLCITEGLTLKQAGEMLGIGPEEMERAVRSPVVARYAAYSALLWDNESLAAHVLDSGMAIEDLMRRFHRGDAVSAGPWEGIEVPIVILHVRYAMISADIERVLTRETPAGRVEEVIRKAVERYPFTDLARAAEAVLKADALRDGGLWRRLVFEYYTRLQLPHKQILERTSAAAAELQVEVKQTTLSSWIGNGRLWAQLAAFVSQGEAA